MQKILVVDDERFNINVLVDLLKPDYKMMVAKNGVQALKAARSDSPPDLVLLDIMMPEMSGYEVCEQLKADPATRQIPIIFVTAMSEDADEEKGLELGAVDYLTKPISPAIVQARVKTQLTLKQSMAELQDAYAVIEAQKDRMQTELDVGRDIQLAMVPKEFPERSEFSIHATLQPAREVGGDFYDCFLVDEDRLCFCVGDVSGKGVPAALFMAMAKTLIKSRASSDFSTASIMTHVNDELSTDNEGCLFVTLFVCLLNIRTGELITTNAGHNPPYIRHADGSLTTLRKLDGMVAGAMEELAYSEQHLKLETGDTLLLFTDGVTEADDPSGALYGEDRLETLFREFEGNSVQGLVDTISKQVHDYEGDGRQADDITILALHYAGRPHEKMGHSFTLKIDNRLEEIDRVNDELIEFATAWGIPSKTSATIRMVFDELLTNVISYAYGDEETHIIEIKVELIDDSILMVIMDDGLPFNPFIQDTPDTELDVDEREIGGLGIHLVMEMLDQVSYQRRVDHNVVTLMKGIDPEI